MTVPSKPAPVTQRIAAQNRRPLPRGWSYWGSAGYGYDNVYKENNPYPTGLRNNHPVPRRPARA